MTVSNFNRLYNQNLQMVIKVIGHDGITTGGELDKVARQLFGIKYKGIFIKGNTKPVLKNNECYIMNYKTNEHWICMIRINGVKYTYDSFNRKNYLHGYKSGDVDGVGDQKYWEDSCGQRCLSFLVTVLSNKELFKKLIKG